MARAGGGGGGGGGWSSRHPQFARGRRLPALLPAPGKRLRATVWDIRRPWPGPKDRLRGSWLQAASPQPGAGGVRSASQRIPPAPSAAPLSPPEPCAALEVRWAVAGRDGQRASPMGGRRGQRGAGPFCRWQGQAPARRPPSPPSPPSFPPSRSAPPGFPALTFPPTRVAALGGQAGMEPSCSRRASQPPPLPGNSQEQTENEQTDVPHCGEETESREG
ncbi:uncharacterized protein LOC144612852 [Panthera onca]